MQLTIEEIRALACASHTQGSADTCFEVGKQYIIRTVTLYHTGRLVRITPTELLLEDAAWIADSGRWANVLAGTIEPSEVEPFVRPVIVSRAAIIDATEWSEPLPRSQR